VRLAEVLLVVPKSKYKTGLGAHLRWVCALMGWVGSFVVGTLVAFGFGPAGIDILPPKKSAGIEIRP
jgi:hypothetical protein